MLLNCSVFSSEQYSDKLLFFLDLFLKVKRLIKKTSETLGNCIAISQAYGIFLYEFEDIMSDHQGQLAMTPWWPCFKHRAQHAHLSCREPTETWLSQVSWGTRVLRNGSEARQTEGKATKEISYCLNETWLSIQLSFLHFMQHNSDVPSGRFYSTQVVFETRAP